MPTSELTDTSLNIAGTTTIKGIESTLTNNASLAATSSAILTAINNSASNVSSYVDSQISNINPPKITISNSTFNGFVTDVLNTFKNSGPYPRHSNIIAEWTNNDFYTFDMTLLDSSNAYGTIVDLLNNMSYTNYNFKYKNGTLFLYNLLRDVGSNGNYYMILNDSVQICWGIKDYTVTEWYQWASGMFEGYPGTTITFAKQFDGTPSIFLSGRTSQNAGCGVEYIDVNATDITGVYILRPSTGTTNVVGYVNYLAIGKPI